MSSDLWKFFEEIFSPRSERHFSILIYRKSKTQPERCRESAERSPRSAEPERMKGRPQRSDRAHTGSHRGRGAKSRRDWSKGAARRKADSQPEQIEEGSHSRRGSEKQTQREGETARAHSRRAGEDAEQIASRHRQQTQSRRDSEPEMWVRSWGDLRQIFQPCPAGSHRRIRAKPEKRKKSAEHMVSC